MKGIIVSFVKVLIVQSVEINKGYSVFLCVLGVSLVACFGFVTIWSDLPDPRGSQR